MICSYALVAQWPRKAFQHRNSRKCMSSVVWPVQWPDVIAMDAMRVLIHGFAENVMFAELCWPQCGEVILHNSEGYQMALSRLPVVGGVNCERACSARTCSGSKTGVGRRPATATATLLGFCGFLRGPQGSGPKCAERGLRGGISPWSLGLSLWAPAGPLPYR